MIYHFLHLHEWQLAKELNRYEPNSVATDGFIHCCTQTQINEMANKLYKGQDDLLLIEIDPNSVNKPLIYEDLYSLNQLFPHLYGSLNLDAIIKIHHVQLMVDGKVVLEPYRNVQG